MKNMIKFRLFKPTNMRNSKPVKNLITGEIYNSITACSKRYQTTVGTISGCASAKYLIFKKEYVFCFFKGDGTEIITDRHQQALKKLEKMNRLKYAAWKISDEDRKSIQYFTTEADICKNLNIGQGHIKDVCDGKRSHVEGWRIAFLDDKEEPILKSLHLTKPKKISKRVKCLNDGKIFKNYSEAGRHYSINDEQIGKVAKGILKSVFYRIDHYKVRLMFAYLDEKDEPIKRGIRL